MKICFVAGDINKTGGTERACLLIANYLSKKYEVTILSFKNGMNPTFECNKLIKLESLHLEKCNRYIGRKINPYKRLKKFLKKNNQDILINVDVILALYTIPMKLFFKIKIIAWEHFNFRINNGVKNRDRARKLCAKFADYIIVLTKSDLNEYKKNCYLKCPIINIYNPIVGNISKSSMKKQVLAVGRFNSAKNFQELINIWEKIEKNNLEWKLIICGDGDEFDTVKNLIKIKKLKNVILPGFCKNIENYYKEASVYVMTSRNEGFPMVLLEAQQHSIPLIAYDCFTGPSEIIENNKNGFLIEYGNTNAFATKLNELMNNPQKLEDFSKFSSKIINKYKIDVIIKKWEDIIIKLNERND